MEQQSFGTANLLPNVVVRTALKMIFTLQKQRLPYALFAEERPAAEWLQSPGVASPKQGKGVGQWLPYPLF